MIKILVLENLINRVRAANPYDVALPHLEKELREIRTTLDSLFD